MTTVKLPKDLHTKARAYCLAHDLTFAQLVRGALRDVLEEDQ